MKEILLTSQYLPNLACFSEIVSASKIHIEAHEHYQKQSYRNRCYIVTANGVDRLTVPVVHHGKVPIQALEIDYRQKWQHRHWRAIQSAYAHAPFFEYFKDAFAEIIYSNEPLLFNLNQKLLQTCLQLLGINTPIVLTASYEASYTDVGMSDFREAFHPRKPLNINIPEYTQTFGSSFEPNMSILDLLFCEGMQATDVLNRITWE